MSDREYSTEEGVVKDELYEELVKHGDEEYDPSKDESAPEEPIPDRATPPDLRPSTIEKGETGGLYEEDESFESGPTLTEGDEDNVDPSRKLYVCCAGRTPEAKRESAEKASALHEKITGSPLEIDE
ncbi:16705_t:CDS:2, partial [Acaulospora colombiana]